MINLLKDAEGDEEGKRKPLFLGVERQRDIENKKNINKKKKGKIKSPYNYNGTKYSK
jgi:hypothetical protein